MKLIRKPLSNYTSATTWWCSRKNNNSSCQVLPKQKLTVIKAFHYLNKSKHFNWWLGTVLLFSRHVYIIYIDYQFHFARRHESESSLLSLGNESLFLLDCHLDVVGRSVGRKGHALRHYLFQGGHLFQCVVDNHGLSCSGFSSKEERIFNLNTVIKHPLILHSVFSRHKQFKEGLSLLELKRGSNLIPWEKL